MALTANPSRACAQVLLKPWPSARSEFIANAVVGRMTPEDQAYMARALLQLSDYYSSLLLRYLFLWNPSSRGEISNREVLKVLRSE